MRFFSGVVFIGCAAMAQAQPYLEFSVIAEAESFFGGSVISSRVGFVVDAADPDRSLIESTLYAQTTDSASFGPRMSDVVNVSGSFEYTSENTVRINVSGVVTEGDYFFSLNLEGGPNPDPDGSLADDPSVYRDWLQAIGVTDTSAESYIYSWTQSTGFETGRFYFFVREVPDPNPITEPACLGDLNGDGNLNYLDVAAFISSYSNGCK